MDNAHAFYNQTYANDAYRFLKQCKNLEVNLKCENLY